MQDAIMDSKMTKDTKAQRLELVITQDSQEATSILWAAYHHVRESNPEAARLLSELRDSLIDAFENPETREDVDNQKTLWLYNRKMGTLPEMYVANIAFIQNVTRNEARTIYEARQRETSRQH